MSMERHLVSDLVKVLDRIRVTCRAIYGFFDPPEIPGAFAELKVRHGARKSHMRVYYGPSDIVKLCERTGSET